MKQKHFYRCYSDALIIFLVAAEITFNREMFDFKYQLCITMTASNDDVQSNHLIRRFQVELQVEPELSFNDGNIIIFRTTLEIIEDGN